MRKNLKNFQQADKFSYPIMRIGIIGGGQLGKMMTQKAKKMGFYVTILDPTPDSPAAQVADEQIVGDFYDEEKLCALVAKSDVTTYDIEHINTEVLKRLYDKGHRIYPSPYTLEIIQDKLRQKETLNNCGIPVPKFQILNNLEAFNFEEFGYPCVQKSRRGGYDGRGVVVIKNKKDLKMAIKTESYLEEFVDIEKELAVLVARNTKGEIVCYPVVEMYFDPRANICDMVIIPARIKEEIEKKAKKIATKTIEAFNGVGIFGIEMFLTKDQRLLVNEIAPRPHNSGHCTIEACETCQFEQHIRAICGLPLGSTKLLSPGVMINLLGEIGYEGQVIIEGLSKALSIPGLSFHLYGKKTTRPFRKMGHITILDKDINKAINKANQVKKFVKIKGEV